MKRVISICVLLVSLIVFIIGIQRIQSSYSRAQIKYNELIDAIPYEEENAKTVTDREPVEQSYTYAYIALGGVLSLAGIGGMLLSYHHLMSLPSTDDNPE